MEKVKNFEARSSPGYGIKISFLKGCSRPSETVNRDGDYKQQFMSSVVVCVPLGRFTLKRVSLERFVSLIRATAEAGGVGGESLT